MDEWDDLAERGEHTISMYEPAFAMARYSPSCEKLKELILCLEVSHVSYHLGIIANVTYSQDVMVLAHIQSFRSNMLTIES